MLKIFLFATVFGSFLNFVCFAAKVTVDNKTDATVTILDASHNELGKAPARQQVVLDVGDSFTVLRLRLLEEEGMVFRESEIAKPGYWQEPGIYGSMRDDWLKADFLFYRFEEEATQAFLTKHNSTLSLKEWCAGSEDLFKPIVENQISDLAEINRLIGRQYWEFFTPIKTISGSVFNDDYKTEKTSKGNAWKLNRKNVVKHMELKKGWALPETSDIKVLVGFGGDGTLYPTIEFPRTTFTHVHILNFASHEADHRALGYTRSIENQNITFGFTTIPSF